MSELALASVAAATDAHVLQEPPTVRFARVRETFDEAAERERLRAAGLRFLGRSEPGFPPLLEAIPYEMPEPVVDLVRALRELSPMQREAVVLHHLADLPVAEVASILGTSRSAVTVHLHRGRKRLKTLLQEASDG